MVIVLMDLALMLSNASITIDNATEGMSLANYDDATNLITPITTYPD